MRLEAERGIVEDLSTSKNAVAAGREPHFDVAFILYKSRALVRAVYAGAFRTKQQSFLSTFLSKHQDHISMVNTVRFYATIPNAR